MQESWRVGKSERTILCNVTWGYESETRNRCFSSLYLFSHFSRYLAEATAEALHSRTQHSSLCTSSICAVEVPGVENARRDVIAHFSIMPLRS